MSDELNLPWKIYYFNENGKYRPEMDVFTIKYPEQLKEHAKLIKRYYDMKLEIRVCDSLDYCIMHFKNGKKIFP